MLKHGRPIVRTKWALLPSLVPHSYFQIADYFFVCVVYDLLKLDQALIYIYLFSRVRSWL